MNKTQQQLDIIEAAKAGDSLVIKAFAGCGKTSTLNMIAAELSKPSLYIAFNKSIAEEASTKFPAHVECKTINSLAWRTIVKTTKSAYGKKLQGFFDYNEIKEHPTVPPEKIIDYKIEVVKLITGYCQSDIIDIQDYIHKCTIAYPEAQTEAIAFWDRTSNAANSTKMTHDVYLKLFQLSKPSLPYSVIYLDEAQDSNNVTLSIVLGQKHAQIIIVGDEYQAIYGWRGAVNALHSLPAKYKPYYLSESFRFTSEIAEKAGAITYIAGNNVPVIGKATMRKADPKSSAILVRTNAMLLTTLANAAKEEKKVYVLADLTDLWKKVYHISSLKFKQDIRYPDKELSQYTTYAELAKAAEKLPELKKLMKATLALSDGGLTANINAIKEILVTNPNDADFTVSTVHKAKGLEWDNVIVSEDIIPFISEESSLLKQLCKDQLLNLIYVAITRAKLKVVLPTEIVDIVNGWEFYRDEIESLDD